MLPALMMFALVSTATPGPNNIMMLASGINFGIRRSIPHWLGICSGVPVMIMAFGLGLEQVFSLWPPAFMWLKILGGSYLLFLAYKIATTQPQTNNTPLESHSKPMTFWQAVLFQWVNPKAWVMCLSAIPAFTSATQPMLPQLMLIAATFCCIGLAGVGCWLFAGSNIQRWLKNPTQLRAFNWSMSLLLLMSIIPMLKI